MGTKGPINNILIPQVSSLPKSKKGGVAGASGELNPEFQQLLQEQIGPQENGVKLSLHAAKRMKERNLDMDGEEFTKLKGAFQKLQEKGGRDSLVITDKAAYIVDVTNQRVVTAMSKENIVDNVFTKIDSTVLV